jgi:molecular chaperone DnaJ
LDLSKGASEEDIRKNFRKKALEFHPDRNKDPDAEQKFKEVNEAYQILTDSEKRARYDRYGHAGLGPEAGFARDFEGFDIFGGLGDVFDSFFGGFSTQARNAPRQGADLRDRVVLSFEEAYFGAEKDVTVHRTEVCGRCKGLRSEPGTAINKCNLCRGSGSVRRSQRGLFGQFVQVVPCPTCRGEGSTIETPCKECHGIGREKVEVSRVVKVPGGVDDGMQVRLTGEGDVGYNGGPAGNLYVDISVLPHSFLQRNGSNLHLEAPINFAQAVLGTELTIPLIEGSESLKVPAGTQPGAVFSLRGKGMPKIGARGRGDLLVAISLEIPTKLDSEQREALETLAETMAWNNGNFAKGKGILDRMKDAFTGT